MQIARDGRVTATDREVIDYDRVCAEIGADAEGRQPHPGDSALFEPAVLIEHA